MICVLVASRAWQRCPAPPILVLLSVKWWQFAPDDKIFPDSARWSHLGVARTCWFGRPLGWNPLRFHKCVTGCKFMAMFCLTIYWVCPRRCPFHAISVMLESVCLANSAIHRGRGNTSFCTARPLVNWLADSFCKTRWQHDWPGSNRWVSHNLFYNIHTSVEPASNSELTTSISHPHIDCAHITTRKCCTHATTRQSKRTQHDHIHLQTQKGKIIRRCGCNYSCNLRSCYEHIYKYILWCDFMLTYTENLQKKTQVRIHIHRHRHIHLHVYIRIHVQLKHTYIYIYMYMSKSYS